jgi:hypothetical protein
VHTRLKQAFRRAKNALKRAFSTETGIINRKMVLAQSEAVKSVSL